MNVPFIAPRRPLPELRVALISTAGLHLDDQPPFDLSPGPGDASYRRIGIDDDLSRLRIWWDVEQQQPASQDLNCAFPIALLRELCAQGEIGSLASTHFTFSGAIPDPRKLVEDSAPAVARELKTDGVDAVLVAPS